jgi:hypothetical protein
MMFFSLLLIFEGLISSQNILQWGFFEAYDTSRHALTNDLIKLFGKYDLKKK